MLKRILSAICLLLLCFAETTAQQYFFRRYSVEEGMPQSSVYNIIQDARGFLWIGTAGGGVTKFDGVKFETFTKADGLADNVVRTIFEDSRGYIWIGTDNGLTYYDGYKFITLKDIPSLNETLILAVNEDKRGIVWIGTRYNGLVAIKMDDSLTVRNFTMEDGLISDFIFNIYIDFADRIWLGMFGGVNILTIKEGDNPAVENIEDPIIPANLITSIEPGENGEYWFGTLEEGLYIARPDGESGEYIVRPSEINERYPQLFTWDIVRMDNGELWLATDENGIIRLKDDRITGIFSKDNGLPSNQIMKILRDYEGNTWFASFGQGAIMYSNDKFISYGTSEGLTGDQVLSIFIDRDKKIYTATEEGFTSFLKDGDKLSKLRHYSSAEGLNDAGATCITRYNDNILTGTKNGINVFDGRTISDFRLNYWLPDSRVNVLYAGSRDKLWVGTSGGYAEFSPDKIGTMSEDDSLINNEIQAIIEDSKGRVWIGTYGGLVKLENKIYNDYDKEDGLGDYVRINTLAEAPSGDIWIGTFDGGIFRFDVNADSVPVSLLATKGVLSSETVNSILFINSQQAVAGNDKGFDLIQLDGNHKIRSTIPYGIRDGFKGGENITNSIAMDDEGMIWFGTKNGMVRFNPSVSENRSVLPKTHISSIRLFFEDVDSTARDFTRGKWFGLPENPELKHNENHLTFEFTGISFSNPDDIRFSYRLERNGAGDWSPYVSSRSVTFSDLLPGNYTFAVRSENKYGAISEPVQYTFLIKPPFWKTKWFIVLSVLAAAAAMILFIRYREKKLIDEKIKLEHIVEERTREVVEQKDEIARQRDIVTYQKKEITDSIQYAKTIQKAVLPDETILKTSFSDYFIIFRPKDIVSGDFYWMSQKGDHIVFTAADCTGHGVPGAFMSMLGVSFLNKIVNEKGIVRPDRILNELRENVILSLKQRDERDTSRDGLDMAICSLDLRKRILSFAGANNPMIIIRKEGNEFVLDETKADSMPVGVYSRMTGFTLHETEVRAGDTIYLFSDGFCDQFGGPAGRKFMKPKFNKMLLGNQALDMGSQKEVFEKTLDEWISYPCPGSEHIGQIDDIILMGLRI